jgi:hypothetical protein
MKPSCLLFMSVALAAGSLTGTAFAEDSSIYFNNKCVDVLDASSTNGTRVQLWDCNGTNAQQWQFRADGTVRPDFNTNKCLDLPGWNTADGTPIQIYDCNGGTNQQWSVIENTIHGFGGKCIDDPGAVTTDGTKLQYWDCNGWVNQDFVVAPEVYGDILTRWLSLGGATGSLGLPTTDELPFANGRIRYFANGYIAWFNGDTVVSLNGNEIILQTYPGTDTYSAAQPITLTMFSNGEFEYSGSFESWNPVRECNAFVLGWKAADGSILGYGHDGCTDLWSANDSWDSGLLYNAEIANDWYNIANGWSYSWQLSTTLDVGALLGEVAGVLGAGGTIYSIF